MAEQGGVERRKYLISDRLMSLPVISPAMLCLSLNSLSLSSRDQFWLVVHISFWYYCIIKVLYAEDIV